MSRWVIANNVVTIPLIDSILVILIFLIVLAITIYVFRRRFKYKISLFERKYDSLTEIKQRFTKERTALDEWQSRVRGERAVLTQRLGKIEEEVSLLANEEAEKRHVINDLTSKIEEAQSKSRMLRTENEDIVNAVENRNRIREQIGELRAEIQNLKNEKLLASDELNEAKLMLDLYVQQRGLLACAHYEIPEYLFQTSERYKVEISRERLTQKKLINEKKAITGIELIADKSERSNWSRQGKLLIRAFNLETDKIFASVRHSNYARTVERVGKIANDLEKLMADMRIGLSMEYVESKLTECTLLFQDKLKAKEEAEEERVQREQLKEERKAQREYEAALRKARDEEKAYKAMLEKAREELAAATDEQAIEQRERILQLERMLEQAHANEQRAMSMAQQTRCGFVYVISNEGSFGKGVYKIGLTRRLDPMDRVKELGDASVPFSFDVHGIIYSEDAPALESSLHRKFDKRRVNVVNSRKEFFRVELNQIEDAINAQVDNMVSLKNDGFEDDDYLEAMRLRNSVVDEQISAMV